MKKKKVLIGIIIGIVISLLIVASYFILTKEDKTTTLNIIEKQWIENNKNKRFDFSVVTDIPIFSYEGKGIFLDFLDNIEEVTGLDFNRISTKYGNSETSEYGFNIVDTIDDNDILIYEDNYVILSNKGTRYETIEELDGLVIGALNSEVSNIAYYLKGANVTFKTCEKVDGLFDAIKNDPKNNIVPVVDAIILPKTIYLDEILNYKDFDISYTISEMSKKFVLTLGSNDRLNDILTKYYTKWSDENFNNSYNNYLLDMYFNINKIDEKQKVQFRSKRYTYGYIDNAPFDIENVGINEQLIDEFIKFANIEISFKKFNNYNDLVNMFNQNEIDFMFDNLANNDYSLDIFNTVSNYDESFVVITSKSNDIVINSVNSLLNNNINVIGDTKIAAYLDTQGFYLNTHKNIEQLVQNTGNSDVIVIDYLTYKFYHDLYFGDSDLKYIFNLDDDYSFVIRDISENETFYNLFNFYLSFINDKKVIKNKYN